LHRRDAEVRQDPGGGRRSREHAVEIREVLANKRDPIAEPRESLSREGDRIGIPIDAEETDTGTRFEQGLRVSAGSESRIHEEAAALRREDLDDLPKKDRRVFPLLNVRRLPSPVSRLTTHNSQLAFHDISSFDIWS
jgi:hypothetical protein